MAKTPQSELDGMPVPEIFVTYRYSLTERSAFCAPDELPTLGAPKKIPAPMVGEITQLVEKKNKMGDTVWIVTVSEQPNR